MYSFEWDGRSTLQVKVDDYDLAVLMLSEGEPKAHVIDNLMKVGYSRARAMKIVVLAMRHNLNKEGK